MTLNLDGIKIPRGTEIESARGKISIVKIRKSRIIMKDGKNILSLAESIQKLNPHIKIELKTNAPLCSKTTAFLNENGLTIKQIVQ